MKHNRCIVHGKDVAGNSAQNIYPAHVQASRALLARRGYVTRVMITAFIGRLHVSWYNTTGSIYGESASRPLFVEHPA